MNQVRQAALNVPVCAQVRATEVRYEMHSHSRYAVFEVIGRSQKVIGADSSSFVCETSWLISLLFQSVHVRLGLAPDKKGVRRTPQAVDDTQIQMNRENIMSNCCTLRPLLVYLQTIERSADCCAIQWQKLQTTTFTRPKNSHRKFDFSLF